MNQKPTPASSPYFFTWSAQTDARPIQLTGGQGAHFQTNDGEVLDFGSLTYQVNLGHGHPRLIRAVQEQAARLCVSMPQAVYPEKEALANALCARAGDPYNKVFFCLGGADANEHALKIARLFTGRHKTISRYRSYHGATMGAVSLTGDWRRSPVEPGLVGAVHVLDLDQQPEGAALSFIPRTLMLEQDVGAVFLEPIVGGNGVLIPPAGYYEEVQAACQAHNALFVADEVLTGFGRTGAWFAFQHYEAEPDLITVGKAVTGGYGTLGAVLVHDRIASFFDTHPLVTGLTHYAHPLGVAAALEALRVYEEEGLVEAACSKEGVLRQCLEAFAAKFQCAGDVRCKGLLAAVDLALDANQWHGLRDELWNERVHVHVNLHVGALIVAPPLMIDAPTLADGVARITRALTRVVGEEVS